MKINSKYLILLTTFFIAVSLFFTPQNQDSDEDSTEEISVEEDERPIEQDESVNHSLPANKIEEVTKVPIKDQKKSKYGDLDDSFTPFDEEGNRYITQINKVGEHLVYHGDVLLGSTADLDRIMQQKSVKQGAVQRWPSGRIPYVIDDNVQQVDKVMDAIEYLNIYTNIKIVPRENEENFVKVTLGESDCYSYAGMKGGMQEIFLVPQCQVKEILHEWMHTLGFFHEQNREDRDQYLKILWDNIEEINQPQFKKLPNDFIGLSGRPFDFHSIMLYNSFTFSEGPEIPAMLTIDGDLLPPNQNLLSDEDIERVNLAYPPNP